MAAGTVRENKTILSAEDRTASAFASFQRNLKDSQDRVESMRGAFAGLVSGGAVGGFILMMENAIDAVAKMKDLASDAGLTVAQFGRFESAARLAGMTLEDVSASMQKFSKTLVAAKDPTSEAAQALKAFGLSAAQLQGLSLDQQYEALARASAKYAGSAEKNAALMALTGKTGAQLQKLFAEIAEQQTLTTNVTDAQADAAKRLQDDMTRLKMSSEGFARAGAATLVPYLQNVLDAFVSLRGQKGDATDTFTVIGRVATYTAGAVGSLWLALIDMGDAIGATAAKAAALLRGDFAAIAAIDADREERLKANNAQYEKMWASLLKVDAANKAAAKSGDKVVEFAPAISKMTDEYKKFAASIQTKIAADQQELDTGVKMLESEKMLKDIRNGVYDKKFTEQQLLMIELLAQEWVATQKAVAAKKELARWDAEVLRLQKDMQQAELDEINARDDLLNAFEDGNAQLQIEVATLGVTATQRDLYLLGLQKEQLLKAALTEKDVAYINKLTEERAALLQNREAAANQVSVWNDLADVIVNTFHRGKDALKDFLRSMLELFAKKYILQIGAAMTGSTSLSAAANTLGQGSAAGSLGNLLGLGGTAGIFGSSAAYGAAIGTTSVGAGSQAAMLAAQTGEFGAAGLSATAGAAGGTGAMLAAAGPYIAFALVAYGLYKAFAAKAGGPKEGGSYSGMFNDVGTMTSGSSPGWYGVSTQNASVQQLVGSGGLTLAQSIARYGGSTTGFGMSLGYDADPRGTANSRLTSSLTDSSGKVLFGHSGMDIGRGNEGAALSLEVSRMIVEGLKHSNINEEVKKLFEGFTGTTQADFDALFASADDLNGALTQMATVTITGLTIPSLKEMQVAGETLSQTAARVTGNFAALQDLFSTDAERRARDEKMISDAFASIGVTVPTTVEEFKALVNGLDLSTESGRALFEVLMKTGPTFKKLMDDVGTGIDTVTTAAVTAWTTMISLNDMGGINIHTPPGTIPGATDTNGARASLTQYLQGSLLSAGSPLDPMAKYREAKRQYEANLLAAQGGNAEAITNFGSYRDAFLAASQAVYASSGQYNTDFFSSFNAGAALTGGAVQPYTTQAANANTQTIVQALAASTNATIEAATQAVDKTNALLERIATNTAKPVAPGALTGTF